MDTQASLFFGNIPDEITISDRDLTWNRLDKEIEND